MADSTKGRLPHDEALAILRAQTYPVAEIEDVCLTQATGRFVAEPVVAPRPIPAADNSAVDGYAFRYAAYSREAGARLRLSGRASAGHEFGEVPPPDTAVRILTGAIMPEGLDTVVMQEDVRLDTREDEHWVVLPPGLQQGANRRLAGEDRKSGAVLVEAGTRLRPQDVASAAASGLGRIRCYAPLAVGVISTGDEILRAGESYVPGGTYDANAPMLNGLVRAGGADCVELGIIPDDAKQVGEALARAARGYRVLVVTGGASLGEEDHVAKAIDALGKRHFWQIAVKPGRPMCVGEIGNCFVMGLPGNPVAVFVCFLLYVRPVLVRLGGGSWPEPLRYPMPALFSQTKKIGRREFWRGRLVEAGGGRLGVDKFRRDGSGLIASLCESDGLIEVAEDVSEVREGDLIAFIPYTEFGLPHS